MKSTFSFSMVVSISALALAMGGCTSTGAHAVSSMSTVVGAASRESQTAPSPIAAPGSEATSKFGSTYRWDDGIAVTVSAPAAYSPSSSAYPADPGPHVVFNVTLTNGSTANYDPVLFTCSAQSGNKEADRVFDTGINDPRTTLLPGRETAFKVVFQVSDPADIVLQVAPDLSHDAVYFTS